MKDRNQVPSYRPVHKAIHQMFVTVELIQAYQACYNHVSERPYQVRKGEVLSTTARSLRSNKSPVTPRDRKPRAEP